MNETPTEKTPTDEIRPSRVERCDPLDILGEALADAAIKCAEIGRLGRLEAVASEERGASPLPDFVFDNLDDLGFTIKEQSLIIHYCQITIEEFLKFFGIEFGGVWVEVETKMVTFLMAGELEMATEILTAASAADGKSGLVVMFDEEPKEPTNGDDK